MWATLELIPGERQPFNSVKLNEVEPTAPIHKRLGEPGHPDQWVDYEGDPSRLGDTVWVIWSIESDWGLRTTKVPRGSRAYSVECLAGKLELTSRHVGSRPTIDQHDHLFFRQRCGGLARRVAFVFLSLVKTLVVM
jgi:hypothetical protein